MGRIMWMVKGIWRDMLELPWRNYGQDDRRGKAGHRFAWVVGWVWAVAGMVLGALFAPTVVRIAGMAHTPYQDWLAIAVVVLVGFLVQLLGWGLFLLLFAGLTSDSWRDTPALSAILLIFATFIVVIPLPLLSVGYGVYRYLSWVGAGQRSVTIALAGGLLIKAFLIPLIQGIVKGALFRWFMRWLRGGTVKNA